MSWTDITPANTDWEKVEEGSDFILYEELTEGIQLSVSKKRDWEVTVLIRLPDYTYELMEIYGPFTKAEAIKWCKTFMNGPYISSKEELIAKYGE